jgi:hypothetical protein
MIILLEESYKIKIKRVLHNSYIKLYNLQVNDNELFVIL